MAGFDQLMGFGSGTVPKRKILPFNGPDSASGYGYSNPFVHSAVDYADMGDGSGNDNGFGSGGGGGGGYDNADSSDDSGSPRSGGTGFGRSSPAGRPVPTAPTPARSPGIFRGATGGGYNPGGIGSTGPAPTDPRTPAFIPGERTASTALDDATAGNAPGTGVGSTAYPSGGSGYQSQAAYDRLSKILNAPSPPIPSTGRQILGGVLDRVMGGVLHPVAERVRYGADAARQKAENERDLPDAIQDVRFSQVQDARDETRRQHDVQTQEFNLRQQEIQNQRELARQQRQQQLGETQSRNYQTAVDRSGALHARPMPVDEMLPETGTTLPGKMLVPRDSSYISIPPRPGASPGDSDAVAQRMWVPSRRQLNQEEMTPLDPSVVSTAKEAGVDLGDANMKRSPDARKAAETMVQAGLTTSRQKASQKAADDRQARAFAQQNALLDKRLEAMKENKQPVDIDEVGPSGETLLDQISNKTDTGRKWVNGSHEIFKGSKGLAKDIELRGVPVLTKEEAADITESQTAKQNMQYMLDDITKYLPKDAQGRIVAGAAKNTLDKMTQANKDLAAVGTYRNAAVQAMRAVAGSKGLRINKYEVEMAIENDIPKITDTAETALKKAQNVKKFLENKESILLDRGKGPKLDDKTEQIISEALLKGAVEDRKSAIAELRKRGVIK